MNQILIVLPFCKADANQAERLLDWIFTLNGCKPNGSILLAAAHDVHQEMVERIKVSADVAFDSFEAIRIPKPAGTTKDEAVNWTFKAVAAYIAKSYRVPFFWMEPDFTPIVPNWIWQLSSAYYSQPKRYCGNIMKSGDVLFPARCITYPSDAINDLGAHCNSKVPFNYSANAAISMQTKSRLVSEFTLATTDDWGTVPKDAIAVHSDKNGIALAAAEARLSAKTVRQVVNDKV